jgi:hypothetical protein
MSDPTGLVAKARDRLGRGQVGPKPHGRRRLIF